MSAARPRLVVVVAAARAAVATSVLAGTIAACERPPVAPLPRDDDDTAADATPDITTFVQDRPAIGGKWYAYSVDGHVLTPKPEAWMLRTESGFAAFRIVSIYDDATGDSGRFTLERSVRVAGAWQTPSTFVVDGNVKAGEPLCVDVTSPAQRACDAAGWHVRFVQQSRLSVVAGFAVAEPAVFLHDDVRVARADLDALGGDLTQLPDPATIGDLVEAPPADASSTEWDFSRFARDLPENGRALGSLARLQGEPFLLVTSAFELATVTLTQIDDATLHVELRRQAISRDDGSLGASVDAVGDVALPADAAAPVFLKLDEPSLRTPTERLATASWPTKPPSAKAYDLVIVDEGAVGPAILLSPATAASRGTPRADPPSD
jgi:hypothetical protein